MSTVPENIEKIARFLKDAQKVTVLSGAGVSKESGIPTFRDAQTGLWAKYDPHQLATPEGFLKDPPLVWQWYDYRRKLLRDAKPNAGHYAIVDLEKLVPQVVVVTQNVDGLHQKAGSTDVIELHGNITQFICFDNQHEQSDISMGLDSPPVCSCGSLIRPAVVWFGESLPSRAMTRGFVEAERSQVILVVGTSALVQPAASIPFAGAGKGAKIVDVNPEETPITELSSAVLRGPSGQMLPQVVSALRKLKS
ncbi:MAG: NAD-dependent deacylase [Cyanobacteria bacterium]|nr:NAD-dependent deacylase [Cyanobacteriota bacterium]